MTTESSAAFPSAKDASPDSPHSKPKHSGGTTFIPLKEDVSLLGYRSSIAAENLNAWGVETFAPKYKERRSNPYTGRPTYFTRSLFPRYMFARFDAGRMLRKVWFTRGVTKMVGFGDGPSPVEDEIIELIKSRVGKEGFVEFNEDLKRGDKVVIRDGPLANLEGIFERDIEEGDRVLMLLTAISYQGHVTVERELLKKIS